MRSLAKKAQDRFDSARDMRKVLENALKDGDVAIAETQRVSRELVLGAAADSRTSTPAQPGLAATVRAATANDLADQLEPGTSGARAVSRKRGGKALWIALALVLVGGGATAAVLLIGDRQADGYKSVTRIKGVTEGQKYPDGLIVETNGKVSTEAVEAAYRLTLEEIRTFEPEIEAKRDVIQEIVAVPQASLCEPRPAITRASTQPCNERDRYTTALRGEKRQLLVADDPTTLAETMRAGVAQAICDFQFLYLSSSNEEDVKRLDTICEMTKRFAAAK